MEEATLQSKHNAMKTKMKIREREKTNRGRKLKQINRFYEQNRREMGKSICKCALAFITNFAI